LILQRLRRLFRRAPADDTIPDWYDSRLRPGPAPGGDPVFLYMPWIPEHGDALVAKIARGGTGIRFHPLDIVINPDDVTDRLAVLVYAQENPDKWRRLLLRKLAPLASQVAGFIVSFDWHPVMREIVYACRSLGIPTFLVPHESVFIDEDRYYVARNGAGVPATDYALVWGEMQRRIFTTRGYPDERVLVTGSPKFDIFYDYRPLLDREGFAAVYGLDPSRPIVLFAGQPLDSQVDSQRYAIQRQSEAIGDLLDVAEDMGVQVVVRQPPARKVILAADQKARIEASTGFAIDGPVKFSLPPEEAIYHSAAILSVNSTMLFEAVLMGRPSISMPYFDFEQIWRKLDIARAPNAETLTRLLGEALETGKPMVSAAGMEWANRELAAGRFDGQAAARVSERLRDFALRSRAAVMRPYRAAEVLAGVAGPGSIAIVSNGESLDRHGTLLQAVLGAKRLIAGTTAQDAGGADYMVRFDQRFAEEDDNYLRQRRSLGRSELHVERGFLPAARVGLPAGSLVSVVLDDVAPHYEAGREPRMVRRLNEPGELDEAARARAAQHIARLRVPAPNPGAPGRPRRILLVDHWDEDRSVPPAEAGEALMAGILRAVVRTHESAEIVVGVPNPHSLGRAILDRATVKRVAGSHKVDFVDADADGLFDWRAFDEVHVAASDAGFAALLAGLPVHCHAAPFYAGWGLTVDHAPVPHRHRIRSLECLFHVAWIEMSRYFDPRTGKRCELEALLHPAPEGTAEPAALLTAHG
jgi:hypothetical protein